MTIQNYFEFESSVVQEAVRDLIGISRGDEASASLRRMLSRRLSNVLSSARLYLETLSDHSKGIFNANPTSIAKINDEVRSQYDRSPHYRLAEALRNYAQHAALPVHGLFGPSSDEKIRLSFATEPFVDPDELREDGRFKKSVLNELPVDGDVVKLKPVLRSYIESLGSIQTVFRAESHPVLTAAFEVFDAARDRYGEAFPHEGGYFSLGAAPMNDQEGFEGEVVYIEAEMQRLLNYFKSSKPSMKRLGDRRIEF